MQPQPPRRARRRPPRAQLAAAPHVTAPAQSEPTRRPRERRRAASESSFLIAPPASPSVRRSSSAPRACSRSRRAERADAPLELSLLLLLTSPRRLNQSQHDVRESACDDSLVMSEGPGVERRSGRGLPPREKKLRSGLYAPRTRQTNPAPPAPKPVLSCWRFSTPPPPTKDSPPGQQLLHPHGFPFLGVWMGQVWSPQDC